MKIARLNGGRLDGRLENLDWVPAAQADQWPVQLIVAADGAAHQYALAKVASESSADYIAQELANSETWARFMRRIEEAAK